VRCVLVAASLAVIGAAGCGGDDTGAGASCGAGPSVEMLAPMDGEEITMADDVDPAMGGLQYELAVRACNLFSAGALNVEVWEVESLSTRYAVLDIVDDDDVARGVVPLVPGDLTFEARSVDGMTRSTGVGVHVALE
jgi:hypothetical protein